MTETVLWLEKPNVMLIILLAWLAAGAVSNIGGREIAVYLMPWKPSRDVCPGGASSRLLSL